MAIGNSETIRSVHNSFTPPQPLIPDEKSHDKDDEAFHFIAYVPVGGALYELDGLKPGPIKLADCSEVRRKAGGGGEGQGWAGRMVAALPA